MSSFCESFRVRIRAPCNVCSTTYTGSSLLIDWFLVGIEQKVQYKKTLLHTLCAKETQTIFSGIRCSIFWLGCCFLRYLIVVLIWCFHFGGVLTYFHHPKSNEIAAVKENVWPGHITDATESCWFENSFVNPCNIEIFLRVLRETKIVRQCQTNAKLFHLFSETILTWTLAC